MDLAARDWLMHALGRCCLALQDPDCAPLLGPTVPGATLPLGARVPGTSLELEPASAAYNLGAMIRGAQPCAADHVAAALAAADYAARHAYYDGVPPPTVADLLAALRRADVFTAALAADAPGRDDSANCRCAADAFVATALLGGSPMQQHTAAGRARRDGGMNLTDEGADGMVDGLSRDCRRAAGENASRALRHALAVLRELPANGARAVVGRIASGDAEGASLPSLGDNGPSEGNGPSPTTAVAVNGSSAPGAPALPQLCLGAAFEAAVAAQYPRAQAAAIVALFAPGSDFEALAVDAFVARLVRN